MKMSIHLRLFLLLTVLIFNDVKSQSIDTIVTVNRVTDYANIFSSAEKNKLENLLVSFENKTTNQVAVVTINTLSGNTIENAALRIFENNGLGQKDLDNGVLVLFAKNDRKVRIEVGFGLEGVLTDALSSRIIRQIMIPEFKEGKYTGGIEKGVNAIIHITGEEYGYKTMTDETYKELKTGNDPINSIWIKIGVTFFLMLFILPGLYMTYINPIFTFSEYTKLFSGETSFVKLLFNILQGIFLLPFTVGFLGVPLIFLLIIWGVSIDNIPVVRYFVSDSVTNTSLSEEMSVNTPLGNLSFFGDLSTTLTALVVFILFCISIPVLWVIVV